MRGLKAWWAKRVARTDDAGWTLYRAVAAQAVAPERLALFGLEDTPENRFEALSLHFAAAWDRLGEADGEAAKLRQGLSDAFVADMDASLRDLGAGDLGVGKRVKALTERLYGRLAAYAPALAGDAAPEAIGEALDRNLYKLGQPADPAARTRAADAVQALGAGWRALSDADLTQGKTPDL